MQDIENYYKNIYASIKKIFNTNFVSALMAIGYALATVRFHTYKEFPVLMIYSQNGNTGKSTLTRLMSNLLGYNEKNISSKHTTASLNSNITSILNSFLVCDDYSDSEKEFEKLVKQLYTKDCGDDYNKQFKVNCALVISTNKEFCPKLDTVQRRILKLHLRPPEKSTMEELTEYQDKIKDSSCILQIITKMNFEDQLIKDLKKQTDRFVTQILGDGTGIETHHSKNSREM